MNAAFREWTLGDLESVRRVTWNTWIEAYGGFIPEKDMQAYFDVQYTIAALTEQFHSKEVGGIVVEVDGKVVGFARTHINLKEGRFYVASLYVLPEFQKHGFGRRIMRMAEEKAGAQGFKEVWLGVMTENTFALEWYKGQGFVFTEELPFTMGGTTVPHLIGYKRIGEEEADE